MLSDDKKLLHVITSQAGDPYLTFQLLNRGCGIKVIDSGYVAMTLTYFASFQYKLINGKQKKESEAVCCLMIRSFHMS